MAPKLDKGTPGVGHNQLTLEARAKLEDEACERLDALDKERREFNARQTRSRKEVMGGIVKGQLAMTSRSFNNHIYEPFKLAQNPDDNAEAIREMQLAQARAWQRVKVGTQKSLFEELKLGDQSVRLAGKAKAAKDDKAAGAKKPRKKKGGEFVEDEKPAGAAIN